MTWSCCTVNVLFVVLYKCSICRVVQIFYLSCCTNVLFVMLYKMFYLSCCTNVLFVVLYKCSICRVVQMFYLSCCTNVLFVVLYKCSICRNHNPVLSSFMTYQRLCNKSYTRVLVLCTKPSIS
jgi:hypothetical protein